MWGDSESASKNTSDTILKIRLRKERFLILPLARACDLVLANEKRAVYVTKRTNFNVQFTVTKGQSTGIQFLSRSIVELRRFFLETFSSYFAS